MKERDYLWDNIKALLIFLVVAGHCIEFSEFTLFGAKVADYFIYSFHMPAFIFVTGFWAKRYCVNGKVRAEKAGTLFAYYVLFQLLFMIIRFILNINTNGLSFWLPCRGLWYILTIFVYYLITPVIEKLPAPLVISVFIILSLVIGMTKNAGRYFSLSRIFVFAPYFFIGYYLSSDTVKKMRSIKARFRIPLGLLLAVSSVLIWFLQFDVYSRYLFFGKQNYADLKLDNFTGSILRAECIVIGLLMIAALLLIMPSKKIFFSKIGERSLQIYILHMLLIICVMDTGLLNPRIDTVLQFVVMIIAALVITAILSLRFFGYPFKWIQSGVNKLYGIKKK